MHFHRNERPVHIIRHPNSCSNAEQQVVQERPLSLRKMVGPDRHHRCALGDIYHHRFLPVRRRSPLLGLG